MTIMTLDIPPIVMETDSGDDISKTTKRRPNCTTTTTTTTTNDAVVSRSTDRRKIGGVRRATSGGPSLSSVRREAEKFNSSLSGFSKSSLPPSTPKRRSSGDHRQRISSADIQRVRTGGSSTADSDDGTVTSSNSFEQQQQQQNNKEHRIRRNRTSDASQISRLSCSDGDIALTVSPTLSANSSTSTASNLGTSNKSKSKRRSSLSSSSQLGDSTTTTTATATVTDDSSPQSSSDKRIDSSGDRKSPASRRSNASNGKGYSEKGKQNARSRRMARAASSDDAVGDEAIATATLSPSASPSASATRTPKSGSRAQRQRVSVPGNEIVQLLSTDCELPLVTGEDDTKSEKGNQNARSRRMAHAASSDNAVVDEATVTASAPVIPKPGSNVQSQRVSVSENEIMQLLSPPSKNVRSGRLRVRRPSSPNDDGDGDDQKNLKRSKSLVSRKDRGTSRPKEKPGDSVPSIKKQEAESDTPNPQSGRTESKLKEYGARRSNSSGALSKRTRQLRRSSNDNDEKRKNHRKPPRRSRSDDLALGNGTDDGLGSFLKHSDTVSRRKTGGSGSRSVASTPIRQHKSRRHHSKVKPIYSDDILEEGDGEDQSDSEVNHNRSLDLDLATARGNFGAQQHLNEKLQLHLTKTDELLYSVFPKHVADALRNGQKVAPENHDIVTIFFCDIVGFTDISSKLDPMKISEMLDRLYNSFDALSDYHDVFKVETIGDAYMAVTNLTKKQPDHCKRITEFAIDAIQVANQTLVDETNPSMGFVNIRVGFHSGSCVSNVVGTRNPRYCLFGDTVNTASRMESHSQQNRIHCSEISASLLRKQCPKICIFPREPIEVKGKGKMKTFWIHTEGSILSKDGKSGKIRKLMKFLK